MDICLLTTDNNYHIIIIVMIIDKFCVKGESGYEYKGII